MAAGTNLMMHQSGWIDPAPGTLLNDRNTRAIGHLHPCEWTSDVTSMFRLSDPCCCSDRLCARRRRLQCKGSVPTTLRLSRVVQRDGAMQCKRSQVPFQHRHKVCLRHQDTKLPHSTLCKRFMKL